MHAWTIWEQEDWDIIRMDLKDGEERGGGEVQMEVESCQTVDYGNCDVDLSLSFTHLVRFLVEFVAVNEKRISKYEW